MAKGIRVEQLADSDKTEVVEVLNQAFKGSPRPILNTRPGIMRMLMSAMQRLFGQRIGINFSPWRFLKSADFILYGIRQDGKLVCVAVLSDSAATPKSSVLSTLSIIPFGAIGVLIILFFRVGRIFRWRMALEFERNSKEMREKRQGRYLDLVAFGTLPAYQKQGFGSEMLRFIRQTADGEGYERIWLATTRDTPAFHLYTREGFSVVNDWSIAGQSGAIMQFVFRGNPPPGADNSG